MYSKSEIRLFILLVLLTIVEGFFLLVVNRQLEQMQNVVATLICSVMTGISVLWFYRKKRLSPVEVPVGKSKVKGNWPVWLLFLAGAVCMICNLNCLFTGNPIKATNSDIIPLIQIMVKRLLAHQPVYVPVPDFGYVMSPNYLPMHWLPYTLAEVGHFDYRWIATGIHLFACIYLIRRVPVTGKLISWNGLLITGLLMLGWLAIYQYDSSIYINTIEMMVAGYYMLFVSGLAGRSAVLRGLFIAFCMMSRFSLVLWLPLWAAAEILSGHYKKFMVACLTIGTFITFIYIAPFLSKDWSAFIKGYNYYTDSAVGEWTNLNGNKQPYHLYEGHGFASLFYELPGRDVLSRINLLQRVHLVTCLLCTGLLGIWYWFNRKKIELLAFLMGSFKIYLSFFLVLIQVPYTYLMVTGLFVSVAMIAGLMRYRVSGNMG